MSAKVVWMHVQLNKSVVVVASLLVRKNAHIMIWKTLIQQLKNQLNPIDIIHNAVTAGWELHALF
jgi:hypothetical protein